jgi:hypothetical protein
MDTDMKITIEHEGITASVERDIVLFDGDMLSLVRAAFYGVGFELETVERLTLDE